MRMLLLAVSAVCCITFRSKNQNCLTSSQMIEFLNEVSNLLTYLLTYSPIPVIRRSIAKNCDIKPLYTSDEHIRTLAVLAVYCGHIFKTFY